MIAKVLVVAKWEYLEKVKSKAFLIGLFLMPIIMVGMGLFSGLLAAREDTSTKVIGGSSDGAGTAASFHYPSGVAVDSSGSVYVADLENDKIRKVTSAGVVTTLAGSGAQGSADGRQAR